MAGWTVKRCATLLTFLYEQHLLACVRSTTPQTTNEPSRIGFRCSRHFSWCEPFRWYAQPLIERSRRTQEEVVSFSILFLRPSVGKPIVVGGRETELWSDHAGTETIPKTCIHGQCNVNVSIGADGTVNTAATAMPDNGHSDLLIRLQHLHQYFQIVSKGTASISIKEAKIPSQTGPTCLGPNWEFYLYAYCSFASAFRRSPYPRYLRI